MKNNSKTKVIILSSIVVVFLVLLVIGGTVAFYSAGASNNTTIGGNAYKFNTGISISSIIPGTKLVPVADADIPKAIDSTHNCVDSNQNNVCGIYRVDITNNGDPTSLYAFVSATTSNFTSNHLKYQVYTKSGSTYSPLSDIMTLSNTTNEKVYFQKNSSNYNFNLNKDANTSYYLVFWISGIEGPQNEDAEKTYSGVVGVESTSGEKITANFSVGS